MPHLVADGVEDAATWLSAAVGALELVATLAQRVVGMELVTALVAVRCRAAAAAARGSGAAPQVGTATAAVERALWGVMDTMDRVDHVWDLADCGATVLEALTSLGDWNAACPSQAVEVEGAAGQAGAPGPLRGRGEGRDVEEPIPRRVAPVADPGADAPGGGGSRAWCVACGRCSGAAACTGGADWMARGREATRPVMWAEGGVPPVPLGLAARALAYVSHKGGEGVGGGGAVTLEKPSAEAGRAGWRLPPCPPGSLVRGRAQGTYCLPCGPPTGEAFCAIGGRRPPWEGGGTGMDGASGQSRPVGPSGSWGQGQDHTADSRRGRRR